MAQWAKIEDGKVVHTYTALPVEYEVNGEKYNVRRLWGSRQDTKCNELGFFICTEVVPDMDEFKEMATGVWSYTVDKGKPIALMGTRPITEEEYNTVVFNKVVKLRIGIKAAALNEMQELLPTINTFDEVGLVALLWSTLESCSKVNAGAIQDIIEIYREASKSLEVADTIKTHTDIERFIPYPY